MDHLALGLTVFMLCSEQDAAKVCRDWVSPFPSGSAAERRRGYAGQAVAKALAQQLSLVIRLAPGDFSIVYPDTMLCWSNWTEFQMLFLRDYAHYGIGFGFQG